MKKFWSYGRIYLIYILSILYIFKEFDFFNIWVVIEFNILFFCILIIINKKNELYYLFIYLIYQILLSCLFILRLLRTYLVKRQIFRYKVRLLLTFILLIKINLFPLHWIYIKILDKSKWSIIFLIIILQKILPLIIIDYLFLNLPLEFFKVYVAYIFLNLSLSTILGLRQSNLKILIGYSSIIQISWVLLILIFNQTFAIYYYISYSFINFSLIYIFHHKNINYYNDIFYVKNKIWYYNIFINFFSLAGIPLFFGFALKLYHLFKIFLNFNIYFIILFLLVSLLTTYFYIRNRKLILLLNFIINIKSNYFIDNDHKFNFKIKILLIFNWLNIIFFISYIFY